jgi:hypothetical protein
VSPPEPEIGEDGRTDDERDRGVCLACGGEGGRHAKRCARQESEQSPLEQCIRRAGLRKGMRVAGFVAQWARSQRELGAGRSVDDHADWWKESRTTWFRRQAEFRVAFPEHATPDDLLPAPAETKSEVDDAEAIMAATLSAPGRFMPPVGKHTPA